MRGKQDFFCNLHNTQQTHNYIKMANTNVSSTYTYSLQTPSNAHVSSFSNIVTQYPGLGNSIDT